MKDIDYADILREGGFKDVTPLKPGGQRRVFRAKHSDYPEEIVVKIGSYRVKRQLQRIEREVNLLRGIDSKYYPKNYDFYTLNDSKFIVVEEYIDSEPLHTCFDKFQKPAEILSLLKELIQGLRILWEEKRTVHRDLKPGNILIKPDGSPVIIDLGIARLLDLESLTYTFALRGPCTPPYAAPEQLSNRKTKISHRTDQFALGIVILQLMMKGKHPFDPYDSRSVEIVVENILSDRWDRTIIERSEFSQMFPLVTTLLGQEPHMRYRTPDMLLEEINKCMESLK
ncbi:hypothetical protein CEE36_03465 [candidate division TA06 bacterium B3_TA06]|uniref:Protein kinase domain-containing protein n=1 Tax=candidate division TA06 bacterium B3_TA06 TaxID=2012487 RepID=A0A532V9B6_UNCT6|nr:MAG: hypothetical protein CEE36_03465 [candidate division TA06 bacterium B3_TA06]